MSIVYHSIFSGYFTRFCYVRGLLVLPSLFGRRVETTKCPQESWRTLTCTLPVTAVETTLPGRFLPSVWLSSCLATYLFFFGRSEEPLADRPVEVMVSREYHDSAEWSVNTTFLNKLDHVICTKHWRTLLTAAPFLIRLVRISWWL